MHPLRYETPEETSDGLTCTNSAFLASAPASVFEKAKDTFTTNNWGNLVMEEDQEVHAWNEGSN